MPTYYGDADIPALLADFGRPVVLAGAPNLKLGLIDFVGKDVLQSMNVSGIAGTTVTVSVQTSALPSPLPMRTAITVDGAAMFIRDRLQEGDGALTHLFCSSSLS
jgi:hypothetical protein